MDVFDLVAKITLDSSEYESGLTKAEKGMSSTGNKLKSAFSTAAKVGAGMSVAVAGGAAAIYGMAKKSADATDHIDKMSQKIGISRESYQELDFILSQSGTSVDGLRGGMKTLTKAMDGASSGSKKNVEQFEKLGVSVTDSNGKLRSQEDVFFDTVSALQKMDNQTEKARLATELFGKSGQELMPLLNGASGSIDEMRQQAHDLGLVLDDEAIDSGVHLTDTIDQVQRAFGAIVTKVGVEVMPIVQKLLEMILNNMPTIQTVLSKVFGVISTLVTTALGVLGKLYEYVKDNIVPVLSTVWTETIQPAISSAFNAIKKLWDETLKPTLAAIWEYIKENIVPNVGPAFEAIKNTIQTVFGKISEFWTTILLPVLSAIGSYITENIVPVVGPAFEAIKEAVSNAFNGIKALWDDPLSGVFSTIVTVITELKEKFVEMWTKEGGIKDTVVGAFNAIKDFWNDPVSGIFKKIGEVIGELKTKFVEAWSKEGGIKDTVVKAFEAIKSFWEDPVKGIFETIGEVIGTLKEKFVEVWSNEGGIKDTVEKALNAIKDLWNDPINGIFENIGSVINILKITFYNAWSKRGGIKDTVSTALNGIKSLWDNPIKGVFDKISEITNALKETFSKAWTSIKDSVTGAFNAVKTAYDTTLGAVFTAIETAVEKVKTAFDTLVEKVKTVFGTGEGSIYYTIKNIIDDIKGLFDFDWTLPEIKLPHFSWTWTDLGLISIPSVSVDWWARGYENPYLFKYPTVMGAMGFGDKGAYSGGEMLYGHDNLMRDIREATGGNKGNMVINVYQQPWEDAQELAERISNIMSDDYDREGAVYA